MSDEIQAIATNNYVLHNIDAKKLYVQEPLFTANSGDAVYVGWRPDETVLWSGDNLTANMPLSESMRNFEEIKFYYGYNDNNSNNQVSIASFDTNTSGCKLIFYTKEEDPNFKIRTSNLSFTDNVISVNYSKNCRLIISKEGAINYSVASGQGPSIFKIIGINRKESV